MLCNFTGSSLQIALGLLVLAVSIQRARNLCWDHIRLLPGSNILYLISLCPSSGIDSVTGLGHLAIQFARALGCDVVVFSGTDSKKQEAERLGATEFLAMKGVKELKGKTAPIDHLLVTTSELPDWNLYMPVMAPSGTIYPLTVGGDIVIPGFPLILSGLRIQGSMVSARLIHRQMLEFAAKHDIRPIIQKFPMSEEGIEEAFKTLGDGKMRYRGVLVT